MYLVTGTYLHSFLQSLRKKSRRVLEALNCKKKEYYRNQVVLLNQKSQSFFEVTLDSYTL